jgi:ribonuclease D
MPLDQLTVAASPDAVRSALQRLADLETVGVDVERADGKRYFRTAALVQVGCGGRVAVIDPLAVPDLAELGAFLADRATVLHALENDLPPLTDLGASPGTVEDTAIAAAILGLPTGLEVLHREVLGVKLPGDKEAMQRADWEARPLSEEMLAYAAADVADLPALWDGLHRRLQASGRIEWYRQELAAARARPPAADRRAWSRTRGAGRLDAGGQARLRALWQAREALARQTDTAPARVASDRVLVDLAAKPPGSERELVRRGLRRQAAARFGAQLLAALAAAEVGAEPASRRSRPVTSRDRELADRLRAVRTARARELGIDPGVLCPGRHLLGAVTAEPDSPEALQAALGLLPWQWAQLGEGFCEALGLEDRGKTEADD